MKQMNASPEEFERGLMLGFARAGKTVEAPLLQLALLAARRKFARSIVVPNSAVPFGRTETKPFMPSAARRELIKLVSGKDGSLGDAIALRVVMAIRESGFSMHPFDFAKLADFVARHAADLGHDARQWLSMVQPEKKLEQEIYSDEAVTESNLAQASRAQRLQFLRDLRLRDPSHARGLLESLIPGEAAETRLKYLSIIDTHLGEADKPFIETLLMDRAPSVKELAGKLLARLPGTDAHRRRAGKLQDYFELKTEGLIRRRRVLRYKGPGKKADEKENQIVEILQDVSLEEFATALDIAEATLADLALQYGDERALEVMVLRMLVRGGRVDILKSHKDKFTGKGFELSAHAIADNLSALSREQQTEVLAIILQPMTWTSLPPSHVVHGLVSNMNSVLPLPIARDLLDSSAWKSAAENALPLAVEAWATVIPAALSEHFADFAESYSQRASTYHRFLHSLAQQP